jgi:hypothetical protein
MSSAKESPVQHAAKEVGHDLAKAAKGEDEPMERTAPQAPFALVGLSYLVVLAVVLLLAAWIIFGLLG